MAEHNDIFEALVAEGVDAGLHESPILLDVKSTPMPALHRAFTLDIQTRNSTKNRDRRETTIRQLHDVIYRIAHLLDPVNQTETQRAAYQDGQNVVVEVMNTIASPLNTCSINYVKTARTLNPPREWLFTDVTFTDEVSWSIATVAAP